MSQCGTPHATGSGTFPPMKRCTRRGRVAKGPCMDHERQMALLDLPDNAGARRRYRRLVAAFEVWEQEMKRAGTKASTDLGVRDAARELTAVARGHL